MCGGTDADGCTVSTMESEHSVRSEGDVAVAVALGGRELIVLTICVAFETVTSMLVLFP